MHRCSLMFVVLIFSVSLAPGQDAIPLPELQHPGSHLLQQDWQRIGPILDSAMKESGWWMDQAALRKGTTWNFAVESAWNWWATDLTTYTEYAVPSHCRAVGENCYIFVADSVWNTRVTQATVDAIRNAFDASTPADMSKGIYQLNTEYFGNPPNVDNDPKIIILILDIKDGFTGSGGYVGGYFYSINQYPESVVQAQLGALRHSNEAEIYYLDANPSDLSTPDGFARGASVTAHEFQHMIHFNSDSDEISFVNEGMSESASALCGYALRSSELYYANTNVDFLSWGSTGSVLNDYSRTALFSWYLVEQVGSSLTKQIVSRKSNGITGYNDALTALSTGLQFTDVLRNFAIAACLNDRSVDTRYGFQYNISFTPTPHRTHLSPAVSATSDTIMPYGTRYILFSGGDSLRISVSATGSLAISAVASGPAGKRIDPISPGMPYVLDAFGTSYTEVSLVFTNLGATAASYIYSATGGVVSWVAEDIEEDAIPTTTELGQNYPNPFNPMTNIDYRLSIEGAMRLSVYDLLGREVAVLVNEEKGAGRHSVTWDASAMSSGVYYYLLRTGGMVLTNKMILLR